MATGDTTIAVRKEALGALLFLLFYFDSMPVNPNRKQDSQMAVCALLRVGCVNLSHNQQNAERLELPEWAPEEGPGTEIGAREGPADREGHLEVGGQLGLGWLGEENRG